MSDSRDDIPSFAELAADPEIAALLDFEPVPRRTLVPGGWGPEKQREFIARLATHGSKNKACTEMCMQATGMTKVQNSPGAQSFRDAFNGAVELSMRRRAEKDAAEYVNPGEKLPTVDHRFREPRVRGADSGAPSPRSPSASRPSPARGEGGSEAKGELADALRRMFVIKIRQERNARLAGRIAEADFYLRQISFFEVALDLSTGDAIGQLAMLRKDGVSLMLIADTEATRMLDRTRRKAWIELALERGDADGRPPQPGEAPSPQPSSAHLSPGQAARFGPARGEGEGAADAEDEYDIFPEHLVDEHDAEPAHGLRSEPMPFSPYPSPAEGYDWEQWGDMGDEERVRAYHAQFNRAAAEEQVKWEAEMWAVARGTAAGGDPYGA